MKNAPETYDEVFLKEPYKTESLPRSQFRVVYENLPLKERINLLKFV